MKLRRIESATLLFVVLSTSLAGAAGPRTGRSSSSTAGIRASAAPQRRRTPGVARGGPLTDAIFTAPVVAGGRVYAVDGAGVAFCLDAATLPVALESADRAPCTQAARGTATTSLRRPWRAVISTSAPWPASYYVLDAATRHAWSSEIRCGEPIFSTPVGRQRAGLLRHARVAGLRRWSPSGTVCWTWDFVKAAARLRRRSLERRAIGAGTSKAGVTGPRTVPLLAATSPWTARRASLPAGGSVVWLEDRGPAGGSPPHATARYPATLGLSIGEDGTVYRQWHRCDNGGQVDILPPGRRPHDLAAAQQGVGYFDVEYQEPLGEQERDVELLLPGPRPLHGRAPDSLRCSVARGRLRAGPRRFRLAPSRRREAAAALRAAIRRLPRPSWPATRPFTAGWTARLYVVPLAGRRGLVVHDGLRQGRSPRPRPCATAASISAAKTDICTCWGPAAMRRCPRRTCELWKIRSPLAGRSADRQVRPFYQLRRLGQHQRRRPGRSGRPCKIHWIRRYRRHGQAPSLLRRRPHVHAHRRRADLRRRAGDRPAALAAVFSRRPHLLHHAAVLPRAAAGAAGRPAAVPLALPGRGHGQPALGSPLRRLAKLEPPVAAAWSTRTWRSTCSARASTVQMPARRKSERGSSAIRTSPRFPASHRPLVRAYDLADRHARPGPPISPTTAPAATSGGLPDGRAALLFLLLRLQGATPRPARSAGNHGGDGSPDGEDRLAHPQVLGACRLRPFGQGRADLLGRLPKPRAPCTAGRKGTDSAIPAGRTGRRRAVLFSAERRLRLLPRRQGRLARLGIGAFGGSDPRHDRRSALPLRPRPIRAATTCWTKRPARSSPPSTRSTSVPALRLPARTSWVSNLDVWDLSDVHAAKLLSSGPRLDPSECIGACVSNGRIFYTGHGAGLQASEVYAAEAAQPSPWSVEQGPAN